MCPLRFILVFLSALVAGFLVLKNINSQDDDDDNDNIYDEQQSEDTNSSSTADSKILKGFWVFVDMASGRYLWRNLVSSKPTSD